MSKVEFKPCPFCGKINTLMTASAAEMDGDLNVEWVHCDSYTVVCDASTNGLGGCGATCGYQESITKAIEAWNTRLI